MKDVMIDIETLGTRATSQIVQIGACYFDRKTGAIGPTFSENIASGHPLFTTDQHTLDWWQEQSQEARDAVFVNGKEFSFVIQRLAAFLQDAEFMWSHATFDIPILMNAFDVFKVKMPVPFRGMRDIRTLMDLADHKSEKVREGIHHNAVDDCKFQVAYCVEALNKLNAR